MKSEVREAIRNAHGFTTQGVIFRFLCAGCDRALDSSQAVGGVWVEEDGRRTHRQVCVACVASATHATLVVRPDGDVMIPPAGVENPNADITIGIQTATSEG